MPHVPETLDELRERRAFECRLTPDRALGSLDEAEAFLLDRGLLTRTADCALPSLYGACHEEAYAPDKPGFGQWPRTKWRWFGGLGDAATRSSGSTAARACSSRPPSRACSTRSAGRSWRAWKRTRSCGTWP